MSVDVVMNLLLQRKRVEAAFIAILRKCYRRLSLGGYKPRCARDSEILRGPGLPDHGTEIDGTFADDIIQLVVLD